MQGIGVIFGEGAGVLALQKWRLIARQFRQNFKPRVNFVHYSPSQRTIIGLYSGYKRSIFAITSSSIRHHCPISTLIQRNPTDHCDIPIRLYPSQHYRLSSVNPTPYPPIIHRKYTPIQGICTEYPPKILPNLDDLSVPYEMSILGA